MSSSSDQLRIVLIGRTGNGKSLTGNSLLHSRTAFHSMQSAQSITRDCQAETGQCKDSYGREKQILVVDTPGFFDTNVNINNQIVERKISSQIFQMTSPGVHAFLIILRIGRFSPEEKDTVDFIKTIFGAGAAKYCIVIFTHEEQLEEGQTLDDFISTMPELRELITNCRNRKLAINNKLSGQLLERKTQQLLQMIQEMVNINNETYYTNAEYQRIEQQRREEQRKREEAELARKKAYEESLIAATREKERRRADELAQKAREEERQKSEKRIKEAEEAQRQVEERARRDVAMARMESARSQSQSNYCSRRSAFSDDDADDRGGLNGLFNQMGIRGGMRSGTPMGSMSNGMGSHSVSARPSAGGSGGRFTGDYMATRGTANGRPIFEGARGGLYHMTPNGNKSYLRK